jgi:hypothetical protein
VLYSATRETKTCFVFQLKSGLKSVKVEENGGELFRLARVTTVPYAPACKSYFRKANSRSFALRP